jgi:hypothetical protein
LALNARTPKPGASPTRPSQIGREKSSSKKPADLAVPELVVTKRELSSFARARQHRVQLDEAERLYGEVLRTHPNDTEGRCGLADACDE